MSTLNCHCHDFREHHDFCSCKDRYRHSDSNRHARHSYLDDYRFGRHHNRCSRCFRSRLSYHDGYSHDSHGRFHYFADSCLCDDNFRVRLSGLRSGMAFRLRQLIDCRVRMVLEENVRVHGKITFIGSDFVEIVSAVKKDKNKHEFTKKVLLVQFDQIKMVEHVDKM